MPDQNGGTGEQTIPVSPTVHIEAFATHCMYRDMEGGVAGTVSRDTTDQRVY